MAGLVKQLTVGWCAGVVLLLCARGEALGVADRPRSGANADARQRAFSLALLRRVRLTKEDISAQWPTELAQPFDRPLNATVRVGGTDIILAESSIQMDRDTFPGEYPYGVAMEVSGGPVDRAIRKANLRDWGIGYAVRIEQCPTAELSAADCERIREHIQAALGRHVPVVASERDRGHPLTVRPNLRLLRMNGEVRLDGELEVTALGRQLPPCKPPRRFSTDKELAIGGLLVSESLATLLDTLLIEVLADAESKLVEEAVAYIGELSEPSPENSRSPIARVLYIVLALAVVGAIGIKCSGFGKNGRTTESGKQGDVSGSLLAKIRGCINISFLGHAGPVINQKSSDKEDNKPEASHKEDSKLAAGHKEGRVEQVAGRYLTVGVNRCDGLPPLHGCENDALKVHHRLSKKGWEGNCLQPQKTLYRIGKALPIIWSSPEGANRVQVVVYVATHGEQNKEGGLALAMPEPKPEHDGTGNTYWLPLKDLKETVNRQVEKWAEAGRKTHILYIFDCCRTPANRSQGVRGIESAAFRSLAYHELVEDGTEQSPCTLIWYATGPGGFARESGCEDDCHGVFTRRLCEALAGNLQTFDDVLEQVDDQLEAAHESQRPYQDGPPLARAMRIDLRHAEQTDG